MIHSTLHCCFLSYAKGFIKPALLLVLFSTHAYAQHPDKDATIVITGTPISDSTDTSLGAWTITATDIDNAGINNVNEAIRKLGGVYGRKNNRGTQDAALDLDGFGENSANNMVVLIDGVRLSENEQVVAQLSAIPIDSVARIDIMRGASSVLYGDGATGGVIHIVTKQMGTIPLTGLVTAELGAFDTRSERISLSRGWEQINLSLHASDLKSDNYRVNNAVSQQNLSGALTWYGDSGRIGIRIDSSRQKSGLPGALMTLAQFEQDPRQSLNPDDHGSTELDRITAFAEKKMGNWKATAALSTRVRTDESNFVSLQSVAHYRGHKTELTPRLEHVAQFANARNELAVGVDLMNWSRQTESNFSRADATQKSSAIYIRNELSSENTRFIIGARREVFNKTSIDPLPDSSDNYQTVQGVNAWEVQGSYTLSPMMNVFAKVGQSYRVANVDDNAFTAVPNTPLLPQISHDVEMGTQWGDSHRQLTLRFFQHRLTNEIYFDPLTNHRFGANTNLDPTRRQGVALDVKWHLSKQFRLAMHAQHVNAVFVEGMYRGKELVLIPKNTVSAYLNWASGDEQQAYIGMQWVSAQRYGGDFNNACSSLIPSHVTVDARYSRRIGDWQFAIAGSNLLNKQYFTNAFGCMTGIYPDDGRQVKVSVQYRF